MAHGYTRNAYHPPREQNHRMAGELQPRGFLLQATSRAQPKMLLSAVLGMAREIPTGGCHVGTDSDGLRAGVSATCAYGCGTEMRL